MRAAVALAVALAVLVVAAGCPPPGKSVQFPGTQPDGGSSGAGGKP